MQGVTIVLGDKTTRIVVGASVILASTIVLVLNRMGSRVEHRLSDGQSRTVHVMGWPWRAEALGEGMGFVEDGDGVCSAKLYVTATWRAGAIGGDLLVGVALIAAIGEGTRRIRRYRGAA